MEHVLKIEVNGKYLTFYPNAKVKMIRKSPLFLNEADPGSRIYTFTIPAEPNAEILDYANLLFSNKKIATYDCNVYLKGNFYKKAKLDITGFTKETFNVSVRFDKPYYIDSFERNIKSFKYSNPTPYRYWQTAFIEWDYAITFYNVPPAYDHYITFTFFESITFQPVEYKYYYYAASPKTIAQYIQEIADWFNENISKYGISAQHVGTNIIRFKNFADRYGYLGMGITPSATALYDIGPITLVSSYPNNPTRYLNEVFHANETINTSENYDYVYFPVLNPTGLDLDPSVGIYNDVVNDFYAPGVGVGTGFQGFDFATHSGFGREKNGFSPFPYLHKVLKYIHEELAIIVEDEFFDNELKTLVLFHNNILTHNYFNILANNRVTTSFRFTEILPDITYKQLIYNIANMFCLVFDYESNDGKLRIIPRKKIIESTNVKDYTKKLVYDYLATIEPKKFSFKYTWDDADDLYKELNNNIDKYNKVPNVAEVADLSSIVNSAFNDLALVYKDNFYYYYSFVAAWLEIGEALQDFINNNSTDEVVTGFSTLFNSEYEHTYKDGSTNYIKWKTPIVKRPLCIDGVKDLEYKERLLFYRGLVDCNYYNPVASTVGSGVYPLGTYHNYDKDGNKIGNYSLAWNAPDGLIDYWWKLWIDIVENTFPLKFNFDFSATEFMQIDMLEKIQVDNQHYLIDEMEVELNDDISLVTVKAYPIKTGE